jgi:hypothetical protein
MTPPNGRPHADDCSFRILRKNAVFAVVIAVIALILLCGLAGKMIVQRNASADHASTFGADGYVRSASYFGDEWHINFWNSEMEHLERDMKQIREDGFDSVILVIPWKEFQPSVEPVAYSDYAFDQLDRVMNAAGGAGLKVYARVGYMWDFVNDADEDIHERIIRLFHDHGTRNAWREYLRALYQHLSRHACFAGGFLTWEDYMPPFLGFSDAPSLQDRIDAAKRMGFQEHVRSQYALTDYNKAFNLQYSSYENIPYPRRSEPAMRAMYDFFDRSLNRLLADGQTVFPNLSMEVRLDGDPLFDAKGNPNGYYKHEATFPCQQSDYTAAMYGIPMDFVNNGERVKAKEALRHTADILRFLARHNDGKPVYIEQFLYYDNTPKFEHNARLEDGEIGTYLLTCPDVLRKYSAGYGVWTYRDYYDNRLYNNGFFLRERGWETEGNVAFEKTGDSTVCRLTAPALLRQQIPDVRDKQDEPELTVSFEVTECAESNTITVIMGPQRQKVTVDHPGVYRTVFSRQGKEKIRLFALEVENGTLTVDNLRLYSHIQNGLLYDPDNRPLEQRDNLRKMNELLAGQQNDAP